MAVSRDFNNTRMGYTFWSLDSSLVVEVKVCYARQKKILIPLKRIVYDFGTTPAEQVDCSKDSRPHTPQTENCIFAAHRPSFN